jgi:hypothetical protein
LWKCIRMEHFRHLGLVVLNTSIHNFLSIWLLSEPPTVLVCPYEALQLGEVSKGEPGCWGVCVRGTRSKEQDKLSHQHLPPTTHTHGQPPPRADGYGLHKAAAPKVELFSVSSSGTPGQDDGKGHWVRNWFTFQIETLIDSDLSLFTSHYHQEPLSPFHVPRDQGLSLSSQGSDLTHSWLWDVYVSRLMQVCRVGVVGWVPSISKMQN